MVNINYFEFGTILMMTQQQQYNTHFTHTLVIAWKD